MRVDNLTICYHKTQIKVSFSCVCLVIELHHLNGIVTLDHQKFMINNKTDALKTDVNLFSRLSLQDTEGRDLRKLYLAFHSMSCELLPRLFC